MVSVKDIRVYPLEAGILGVPFVLGTPVRSRHTADDIPLVRHCQGGGVTMTLAKRREVCNFFRSCRQARDGRHGSL